MHFPLGKGTDRDVSNSELWSEGPLCNRHLVPKAIGLYVTDG